MFAGRKIRSYFLLLASLPMLSSCGEIFAYKATVATLIATSHGVFQDPKVNLKSKNYAAADFMYQEIKDKIPLGGVIVAKPLGEVDNPSVTSPFGLYIPEGVGQRFQSLGYKNVILYDVAPYGNKSLYPKPASYNSPDYILNGYYAVKPKTVDVYLRIVDARSKEVVGTFDYTMPLSREIRKMSENETRIFRIKK